ncbi:tigger transposable element-derived protein 4 [Plakobranchus ocellatus]|uniref:Tigger transposable element-derived protein 4 n=1 Tax=Plakobranchus ocellatus TaxID=259542 RepID=A0AAV3ZMW3_9GAST|nr:tigger transposable element-derived protein 4 [Plakobranchus ocellatus]
MYVPISGPILFEKGEQLAQEFGHTDCKLSRGWLDRFKLRHGIVFKPMRGEAASAKDIDTSERQETVQKISADYSPRDVFNADETGLFYKCLPNKSLMFQGQTCSGHKTPKERVSLLCAANMDGSEKLSLLMIGKFGQSRCFKGINTLPVTYRHNKKAWMTSSLLKEVVQKQDRCFLMQGRSVALVLDNCSAHQQVISGLQAIIMFFAPQHDVPRHYKDLQDHLPKTSIAEVHLFI